jgi:transposase
MERAEAEAIYDAGREACVEFLLELSARYEAQIARLQERIRRLEEQARQSSRNSSRPPSSDPPKTRRQRRAEARAKAKGERNAGAQMGHRGYRRRLSPEDQVDEIVDHYPQRCRGCAREFPEDERKPSRRFGRHQVAELPPMAVLVAEHRTHRLRCRHCARKTAAQLPRSAPGRRSGRR